MIKASEHSKKLNKKNIKRVDPMKDRVSLLSFCCVSKEAFHVVPVLVAERRGRVNPGLKTWSRYFTTKAEGPLHSEHCRAGGEAAG